MLFFQPKIANLPIFHSWMGSFPPESPPFPFRAFHCPPQAVYLFSFFGPFFFGISLSISLPRPTIPVVPMLFVNSVGTRIIRLFCYLGRQLLLKSAGAPENGFPGPDKIGHRACLLSLPSKHFLLLPPLLPSGPGGVHNSKKPKRTKGHRKTQ